MKYAIVFTFLGVIASVFSCGQRDQEPLNVLFILVDDLGYADLGFMGSSYYETPNIDKLSEDSWIFTHGYSGSRVCSPARATIMTGQFTARHGITDWIGAKEGEAWREQNRFDPMLPAFYRHGLDSAHTTLAEAFKARGFRTFYAGKWHLGDEGSYPEDHGFDRNVGGWEKGSPMGGFFSPYQNPKITDGSPGENLTTRLASEVATFMEEKGDSPFFAMLSFYAVHAPIQTTEEKWAKYREKAHKIGVAEEGFEMGEKLPFRKVQDNPVYAGLVETMDDAVGIVVDQLKALGLYERTIIVFTSDNGGVVAGDAFATSNLLVKGGKGQHWEGGFRVPYLIRVPHLKPNGKISYPVTGADFFPTLLDLTGLPLLPMQHLDGVSLKPLMEGYELPDRALVWHYPHYGNQGGVPSSVIRKGPWKLIHHWETNKQSLYFLPDDPLEEEDVAQAHNDIRVMLQTELSHYLEQTNASLPEKDPLFDEEKYNKRLADMRERVLPNLEKQRLDFLDPNWQPNPDWWGSQPLTLD
jgi:arylsulfatase A-like enzyme